ncbi:MAG: HAMP domain-containing protein (plasmid) [Candidatus Methanoperedens sp.]|nr:MAG: HAMP domain-containing protein [Candidatus Methanoperedens sp.]
MKIRTKLISGFLVIVLLFGIATIISQINDKNRENENTIRLYEDRGVAIAKALDATIDGEAALVAPGYAQGLIDRAIESDMGIEEFSIHAKAPDGKSQSGYWRLASNDRAIVETQSDPEDLQAIIENKYNVIQTMENGVRIIDVTYPLHDGSGKPIATAGIKFSMEKQDKSLVTSSGVTITLIMMVVALVLGFVISNSLTNPIKQLKDVADKVTNGDFSAKLPEAKSDDEISELTASMEMLIMSLKSKTGK